MKHVLTAAFAVLLLGVLASPSDALFRSRAMSPEQFVRQAATSNQFEIKSSELALQKSNNASIKEFAQRMINDHTQLADQMKQKLQQANLPAAEPQLDQKHQTLLKRLEGAKDGAFDRDYVREQRQAHKETLQLLQNYARRGTNGTLKQLASSTLPMIQEHMKLAEQLPSGRGLTARR